MEISNLKLKNIWHLLYMLTFAIVMIVLAKASLKMEIFGEEALELTNTDIAILMLSLLYHIIYATALWLPLLVQEIFETFFDINLEAYFKNKKLKKLKKRSENDQNCTSKEFLTRSGW